MRDSGAENLKLGIFPNLYVLGASCDTTIDPSSFVAPRDTEIDLFFKMNGHCEFRGDLKAVWRSLNELMTSSFSDERVRRKEAREGD